MRKLVASLVLGFLAGSALLVQAVGPVPFQSIFLRDLTASKIVKVDANKETADSLLGDDGTNITLGSGQFLVPNGGASTPPYSFTNDTDMGMYRIADNRIGFQVEGALSVEIANSTSQSTGILNVRGPSGASYNLLADTGGLLQFPNLDTTSLQNGTIKVPDILSTTDVASGALRLSTGAGRGNAVTEGIEFLVSQATASGTGAQTISEVASVVPGGFKLEAGKTITFPDNTRQTFNPGADAAGLNVGSHAGDPGTPSNGDLWYDSAANELTAYINGSAVALGASGSGDITDVWGCSTGDCSALTAASGDTLDATAADSTAPVKDGTSPPGTCSVSEMFFDTDETAGLNLYGCTSSNTWTLLGDGGGGGGGDSVSVNGGAATDANFIDGGGLDWTLNTGATPDEISAKVKPWEKFTAQQAFLPASSYATHDTRNTHPVLDFDASADECAYFGGFLKDTYASNGLTVTLAWMATSATSGATGWLVAIERHDDDTLDLDSDSFAANQSSSATTASGSGEVQYTDITFTDGAQMDSLAAGESYRLRVCRDGDGSVVTDDMTGDAELLRVVVRET